MLTHECNTHTKTDTHSQTLIAIPTHKLVHAFNYIHSYHSQTHMLTQFTQSHTHPQQALIFMHTHI